MTAELNEMVQYSVTLTGKDFSFSLSSSLSFFVFSFLFFLLLIDATANTIIGP